jgi:tRNA dimethylallyltransferase
VTRSDAPLLVIVGPTAVGKTALSLDLAERLGGEIVSADSRQVYTRLDIGTAKPTPAERARAPHHLIDIIAPDEALSVAEYQRRATQAIAEIHARNRLPIFVGGTGQYVAAVLEGWSIPAVAPAQGVRAELEAFAQIYGPAALHARLLQVDPAAASAIDYRNVRRVARALEVFLETGSPISTLQRRNPPPYRVLKLGLTMPRDALYQRIDARIDGMVAQGLVAEIDGLVKAGYTWELPAMSALGYREFRAYLDGAASLGSSVAEVKRNTRNFVRKQYNWFRLADPSIVWLDAGSIDQDAVTARARAWLDGADQG